MKAISLSVVFVFIFANSFSCTTFLLNNSKGELVFGRNFDFPVGIGHVNFNYRGVEKTAFIRPPEKAIAWKSKYGSVTFNQIGREFPYGGMNEKGLVIEQMWLQEAQYPDGDERFGITELQWVQYQLDVCETVDEVIQSDKMVRISYMSTAPLHFLVADASGNVATIEYLNGELSVHQGANLPHPVLANCTYEHSLAYKKSKENKEAKHFNNWTINSSGRFARAARLIENYDGEQELCRFAFSVLDSVAQNPGTQWSIVYDISRGEINYKTTQNKRVQQVNMNRFDFSCKPEKAYLNLCDEIADGMPLKKLTFEENLALINKVVEQVDFLKNSVPEGANEALARYVDNISCGE
nr:linear amide C-N hydrolase [uncultured Draconibacterium sp.]